MSRSFSTQAIILRTRPIGEIHAGVDLLTADRGLISAVAHGARSAHGSLRSACQGFNQGLSQLYHDPVKQSFKLQDFQVAHQFERLKADLGRLLFANLWAELFLRVHQGAGWEQPLLAQALQAAEAGRPALVISVQLLVRYLLSSGIQPNFNLDAQTGLPLADNSRTVLLESAGGLVTVDALDKRPGVEPVARRYLLETYQLDLNGALAVADPGPSLFALHAGLIGFIESHFGIRLTAQAWLTV